MSLQVGSAKESLVMHLLALLGTCNLSHMSLCFRCGNDRCGNDILLKKINIIYSKGIL